MNRNFILGSNWLYYKIYVGVKTADLFLTEHLQAVIFELQQKKLIDKWFFIRYKDPDAHLRIRFYTENSKNVAQIISHLFPILNKLINNDVIWKVQTDTYQREIERYGKNTIEEAETLFWLDSELVVDYLKLKPFFDNNETTLLFSFLAIDTFLDAFSQTISSKLSILNDLQTAFKKEHNADKDLKKELDKNYRDLLPQITLFLTKKAKNEHPEIFDIISKKQNRVLKMVPPIAKKIESIAHDFLKSHIHMMINRQFTSNQRKYELVIYDHLHRYYKMVAFCDKNL
jgi:thiopeptide-type bacteriocin biosynthesis protein